MGATAFYYVLEFLCLFIKRCVQLLESGKQHFVDLSHCRNVHCGRESIVARLALVNMVVRMHRLLGADHTAQNLNGTVGDDFVGIHVCLRSATSLKYDQWKFVVMLTFCHLFCSLDDSISNLSIKLANLFVDCSTSSLQSTECMNQRVAHARTCRIDLKVLERSLRLCSPKFVGRNQNRTNAVLLFAGVLHINLHRVFLLEKQVYPKNA
mmetsp:Transcript_41475/g.69293  ORF Transcript_41475/g.69293 Transcript_41475/m.69293 type:complete len:209 (-) Transcript_41475:7-633(-)